MWATTFSYEVPKLDTGAENGLWSFCKKLNFLLEDERQIVKYSLESTKIFPYESSQLEILSFVLEGRKVK